MTAKILDGLKVSNQIKARLKEKILQATAMGHPKPCLSVILVGNNPASQIYVKKKQEACQQVGIESRTEYFPENVQESEVLSQIKKLNEDPQVHGILIQLPLPPHLNPQAIIESLSPQKDVDGFHPYNLGRLVQRHPILRPCTPYGIIQLLQTHDIQLKGLHAVIVGCSNIVGRPMALELLMKACTITVCHRFTKDLEKQVKQADLLVAAIGNPGVIQSHWIQKGAIAVDVGINRLEDGKIMGDLDFDKAKEQAGWITPVPGGVGPMTVAALLENTWLASKLML